MFLLGCLFFAFTHNILIINWPHYTTPEARLEKNIHKKNITFIFPVNNQLKSEKKEIIWSTNNLENIEQLVKTWLSLLDQENITTKKVSLQSCAFSASEQQLYLSFDRSPLAKQSSTYSKLLLIESLLQTIRDSDIHFQTIQFLNHHQPLIDNHLDFSKPIPLTGFLGPQPEQVLKQQELDKNFILVLHPAGDAKSTERTIYNNFERGLMLQYAQELKKIIEKSAPHITVIITRHAGDIMEPLENIALANRLQANLYLSLHAYAEQQSIPTLRLYYLLYNPVTDIWHKKSNKLACIPLTSAYLDNLVTTQSYATFFNKNLLAEQKKYGFITQSSLGTPFKPLVGLCIPALALEIGVTEKQDILSYATPVALSIINLVSKVI